MKLSKHQQIFTTNIARLIVFANTQDIELTFGEAFRTKYQQEEHVRQGKSKTMNSNHLRRLAVDFNPFLEGKLTYKREDVEVLGEYWELLDKNNRWGGNFTSFYDPCHFEMNI
jgi:hypothetical protein